MTSLRRVLSLGVVLTAITGVLALKSENEGREGARRGYALELLWWPEYCHEHPELRYCAGASFRGFVPVEFADISSNGQVETCAGAIKSFNPDRKLLSLLPDEALLRSQWDAHGTCSGLSQSKYFDHVAAAFKSVTIPRKFVLPDHDFRMSPDEIKQEFLQTNRGLSSDALFVFCRSGFLSIVRIQTVRHAVPPRAICTDATVEIIARMPLAE